MAALVPIEVLGFAPGDPVTSVQMNLVNTQLPKAPNFVDGLATYNPAGLIQIGGAGLRWNGPTLFAGTSATTWADGSSSEWQDGSTVTFGDGSLVTVELDCTIELFGGINVRSGGGIINVSSGGVIDFDSGGLITGSGTLDVGASLTLSNTSTVTAQGGATIAGSAGSIVNLGGVTTFTGGANPQLSPARSWTRRNLRMCATSSSSDVTETGSEIVGAGGNYIPSVKMASTVALSPVAILLEIDNLPEGQVITSVVVRTIGHSSSPGASIDRVATYRVIRWTDETTLDSMSSTVNDSHIVGDWQTYKNQTITITSSATIDRSYRYAVQVINHEAANADAMHIISVVATGTATSIRV